MNVCGRRLLLYVSGLNMCDQIGLSVSPSRLRQSFRPSVLRQRNIALLLVAQESRPFNGQQRLNKQGREFNQPIHLERNMITGPRPVLMALAWVVRTLPSTYGFSASTTRAFHRTPTSLASTSTAVSLEHCLSRLGVLQTLLEKHGAPGSASCGKGGGDLQPIATALETPELVQSLTGPDPELQNLHPYLMPITKSTSSPDSFICAYRNPFVEESDKKHPWPIVEARLNGPGMRLLALNSEHLMRRIACEADAAGDTDLIQIYNEGLAEAANGKLAGFGSNFLYYSQLLASFPNREEESRDAARMCLRLPLPTIGLDLEQFRAVAVLSQAADESDSVDEALTKLAALYEKMREVESEENTGQADGKTLEQMAIDEANGILDQAVLKRQSWGEVRPAVAEKFRSVGRQDFARFVDLQN
eukprot:scaffold14782_cov174-Amphora_coffeaeformis.AAC.8